MVIPRRWAVSAWRAIVTRAINHRTLDHIGRLIINRWRWWRVIHRRRRDINRGRCCIHRSRGRIHRAGSHCCANHAADDCADDCRSTPAWTAAMGFSLACKGEGT
jgi:hypothetical protein